MEMRAAVMVKQGEGGQEVVLRQLPPGFRFRPTDEEVVVQYLRRKALALPLPADVIPQLHNLYSLDPWDIPGATEGEKYFFALRPKIGGRSSTTATASGCWKPAVGGKDRPVVVSRCGRNHLVGVKRSMAFVPRRSRPGKGGRKTASAPAAPVLQTGWVMHEYRLALPHQHKNGCCLGDAGTDEWVVCRIFKKDRLSSSSSNSRRQTLGGHGTDEHRTMPMPQSPSSATSSSSCVTSGSSSDLQEEVSS